MKTKRVYVINIGELRKANTLKPLITPSKVYLARTKKEVEMILRTNKLKNTIDLDEYYDEIWYGDGTGKYFEVSVRDLMWDISEDDGKELQSKIDPYSRY